MVKIIKVSNGWFVRISRSEHGMTVTEIACQEWEQVIAALEWARNRGYLE